MKTKLPRLLMAFLCAWAMSAGNILCLTTGFDLPVNVQAVFLVCGVFALLWSLLFSVDRFWPLLIAIAAALTAFVWYRLTLAGYLEAEALKNGFFAAVEPIVRLYKETFDEFSGLTLPYQAPEGTDATAFLCVMGLALSMFASGTVIRGITAIPLAIVSGLLLNVTLMILLVMPAPWAFLLLAWSYILLLLTRTGRKNPGAYSWALAAAVPAAALLIALCALVRPSSYVYPDWLRDIRAAMNAPLDRYLLHAASSGDAPEDEPFSPLGTAPWNSSLDDINLSTLGPHTPNGSLAMTVEADVSGRLYLRGASYVDYDGISWTSFMAYDNIVDIASSNAALWTSAPKPSQASSASIETARPSSVLYLPYRPQSLPEGALIQKDTYILNGAHLKAYDVSFLRDAASSAITDEYQNFVYRTYTQLPYNTRPLLEDILSEIIGSDLVFTADAFAERVAEYVSSSAAYDLNTPVMQSGEDFVSWFLHESDTGYCVHFASAAAVLLRCFDVPARLVTGYMVETTAGQSTRVTQDKAHAWVEYYVDGFGWKVLEATPGLPGSSSGTGNTPGDTPDDTIVGRPPVQRPQQVPELEDPDQPSIDAVPEQPTQPEEPNGPAVDPGSPNGPAAESAPSLLPLWIGLGLVLLIALLPLWRRAVLALRRRELSRGAINERALKLYRRIERMCRIQLRDVPEDAYELALIARFSAHDLTSEQLETLTAHYDSLRQNIIDDYNPFRRFFYRYILPI